MRKPRNEYGWLGCRWMSANLSMTTSHVANDTLDDVHGPSLLPAHDGAPDWGRGRGFTSEAIRALGIICT